MKNENMENVVCVLNWRVEKVGVSPLFDCFVSIFVIEIGMNSMDFLFSVVVS